MSGIPREKRKDNPQRPRSLAWVNLILLLISSSLLFYFHQAQFTQKVVETPSREAKNATRKNSSSVKVNFLDINEEEYIKLGLTPTKPAEIISTLTSKSMKIHGRFLHITDIHPDEHYRVGSDVDTFCHSGKPRKGENGASKYGDAILGCDSPIILMNQTLEWIKLNLRDKIDFVIWTGDNIRHDNDRRIPRTEMAIFDMNREVSKIFHDIFHGDEIDPRDYQVPVIPSLGNNDVYPHNLFAPGPTLQTREMWSIWQSFVPEEQLHIFERGAYFFNEVIPNQLAVLSINTLYLFKSNPLVDNCDNRKDPGYKLFTWLGYTLQELRERKMKVWLSGHVPPVPKNYDITCYRKFAIWLYEYRDVIIGGVYGHMNVDHFVPVDAQMAYDSYSRSLQSQNYETNDEFNIFESDPTDMDLETLYLKFGFNVSDHDLNVAIASNEAHALGGRPTNKEEYMNDVRQLIYSEVKGLNKAGEAAERYAITNVAASVVPTFNPGFRVWEYNITGIEDTAEIESSPWTEFFMNLDKKVFDESEDDEDDMDVQDYIRNQGRKGKKGKKKKPKKDPSLPPKKPSTASLGPGYTPQLFSPTKFVQYYLDLKSVNKGEKPFEYEVEYKSDDSPLNLKGLLVQDFVELSRRLGKSLNTESLEEEHLDMKGKHNKNNEYVKLWETYLNYAFVSSGYHDDDI